MLKNRIAILLCVTLFLSGSKLFALDLPTSTETMTLGIGKQITFSRQNLKQVSIANPSIAEARLTPDKQQIVVTTLSTGNTDLILWQNNGTKKNYSLRVVSGSAKQQAQELSELLKDLETIQVQGLGEKILIEGEVLRPGDLKRIQRLAQFYPNVNNLAKLSEEVQPILKQEINFQLAHFGFQEIKAEILAQKIYLTGEVVDEKRHEQALTIAKTLYPDIDDLIRVGSHNQPLIRLDLTLVEINKSKIKALGIRWQNALDFVGNLEVSTNGSSVGFTSNPIASIDMVEKKGWGRIITKPKLSCRSGSHAEFHAGGELPIRLISERTADITYKPYGIILKMSPSINQEGNISLTVYSEISTLDGSNSIEGIPAFLTRRISTAVTVQTNQTLILGGLRDHNNLKATQKIPGLGHIPFLGELFKSRQNRDAEMELLIFIEPVIVDDLYAMERKTVDVFQKKHQEQQERFKWHLKD